MLIFCLRGLHFKFCQFFTAKALSKSFLKIPSLPNPEVFSICQEDPLWSCWSVEFGIEAQNYHVSDTPLPENRIPMDLNLINLCHSQVKKLTLGHNPHLFHSFQKTVLPGLSIVLLFCLSS